MFVITTLSFRCNFVLHSSRVHFVVVENHCRFFVRRFASTVAFRVQAESDHVLIQTAIESLGDLNNPPWISTLLCAVRLAESAGWRIESDPQSRCAVHDLHSMNTGTCIYTRTIPSTHEYARMGQDALSSRGPRPALDLLESKVIHEPTVPTVTNAK